MEKFYAKLTGIMTLIGAAALILGLSVPYWRTMDQGGHDVSMGLFSCRYKDHQLKQSCPMPDPPEWKKAVRALVILGTILALTLTLLLLVYCIHQNLNTNKVLIKFLFGKTFLVGILVLSGVILFAVKGTKGSEYITLDWAFGLTVGASLDFFIVAVPLYYEVRTNMLRGSYDPVAT